MSQEIIEGDDLKQLQSKLKRVHGHYFNDESLLWNLNNFISCSVWNHRWGRKFADELDQQLVNIYRRQLNESIGRCKNLLSYSRKLRDELSSVKQENNRLKQIIKNNTP